VFLCWSAGRQSESECARTIPGTNKYKKKNPKMKSLNETSLSDVVKWKRERNQTGRRSFNAIKPSDESKEKIDVSLFDLVHK
jgi:hypothetical protein